MTQEPSTQEHMIRARDLAHRLAWAVRLRLDPIDERGGGRNSDEGMHIGAGAVIAGTIAAGVAAFVASKLGALDTGATE